MKMNRTWLISGVTTVAVVAIGIALNRSGEKPTKDVRLSGGMAVVADPVATVAAPAKRVTPPEPVEEVPQVEVTQVSAVAADSAGAKAEGRFKNEVEKAREQELAAHIAKLTPRQVAGLVDSIATSTELADEDKAWWIFLGLQNLFSADVEGSLSLLEEHSEVLLANRVSKDALTRVFGRVATTGSGEDKALLENFLQTHPEFAGKEATVAAVRQAGMIDTPQAFQLLRKNAAMLGDKQTKDMIQELSARAASPEASLVILQEVRNWPELKEGPNEYGSPRIWAVRNAANAVMAKGFESSAEWFQQAKLDGEEIRAFAMAIGHGTAGDDLGKWLNWTGENAPRMSFPEDKRDEWWEHIRDVIEDWVEDDAEKVSQWLETQPPGEVRDGAIVGYARTIQEDHPDEAADWVKLMSREELRQTMLNQIYQATSFDRSADAEAFVAKHGIVLKNVENE